MVRAEAYQMLIHFSTVFGSRNCDAFVSAIKISQTAQFKFNQIILHRRRARTLSEQFHCGYIFSSRRVKTIFFFEERQKRK